MNDDEKKYISSIFDEILFHISSIEQKCEIYCPIPEYIILDGQKYFFRDFRKNLIRTSPNDKEE